MEKNAMITRQDLINQIERYQPFNEQEEADKFLILQWIRENDNAFLRENTVAHMTASAWVVNKDRSKVLMVYHNIYDSWSWLGGHADGETDLLAVALREVKEEAGDLACAPGIGGDLFSGISYGGWACQEGKVCIQPSAPECDVSSGSRLRGSSFDQSR